MDATGILTAILIEDGLTPAEARVAINIVSGLENQEIADILGVKAKTVKFHLTNIYRKFKVKNRTQAALKIQEIRYN